MLSPAPTELRYQKDARVLVIAYDAVRFELSAEFLRVNSPSAEVQGHGGEGGELPRNKENVAITGIAPVGNYAVKISFSDGHDTGLYSWDWLQELCRKRDALWTTYQERLRTTPDPAMSAVRFVPATPFPKKPS